MTLSELEALGVQCVGGSLIYNRIQIGSMTEQGPDVSVEGYRLLPVPSLPEIEPPPRAERKPRGPRVGDVTVAVAPATEG